MDFRYCFQMLENRRSGHLPQLVECTEPKTDLKLDSLEQTANCQRAGFEDQLVCAVRDFAVFCNLNDQLRGQAIRGKHYNSKSLKMATSTKGSKKISVESMDDESDSISESSRIDIDENYDTASVDHLSEGFCCQMFMLLLRFCYQMFRIW
ncbi:hypothetical protein L1887_17376 [Cichorium endivia]|nr:hypothetical protein L1887_17376 [Cichorium endivia]